VTYLSGIENGKRNPGLLVIARLARALEILISGLFLSRRT
jgi:transcriptional regulator with XRE-family HTH domain